MPLRCAAAAILGGLLLSIPSLPVRTGRALNLLNCPPPKKPGLSPRPLLKPARNERLFPNSSDQTLPLLALCSAQSSGIGACKCIYIDVYISRRQIMAIARVFKSGNSQAVRLPKKFRVKSSEVEIFRRGDEIVLREKAGGMVRVLDLLAELPADMFPKKRKDPHPQRRKGL